MAQFTIQTPPKFSLQSTVLSHGWYQLPPFRYDEDQVRLERTLRLEDGERVELVIQQEADIHLTVQVDQSTAESLGRIQEQEIRTTVGHILTFGLDLEEFYELLTGEERYAWVEARGWGRLLRAPTVWEDLAKTLLTTNTSWNMTRQMVRRLVSLGETGQTENRFAFPEPGRIADLGEDGLAAHLRAGYRTPYLHELARKIAGGELDVEAWSDPDLPSEELYENILNLTGFGPYAAAAMLKLLGHFDQLALDSAARNMFASFYGMDSDDPDEAIRSHYRPYGRWQGLVLWMDLVSYYLGNETPDNTDEH